MKNPTVASGSFFFFFFLLFLSFSGNTAGFLAIRTAEARRWDDKEAAGEEDRERTLGLREERAGESI